MSLLTVAALSACGTTAKSDTPGAGDDDGSTVINETAVLSAYPGAIGTGVVPPGLNSRTTFATDASLRKVFTYLDGQLSARGWQRRTSRRTRIPSGAFR